MQHLHDTFPYRAGGSGRVDTSYKGSNFSPQETRALLEGLQTHRETVVFSPTGTTWVMRGQEYKINNKQRAKAWKDICERVKLAGNGVEVRTIAQLKYRWKNLRHRAYQDYNHERKVQDGTAAPEKRGQYSDAVIMLLGKERIEEVCTATQESMGNLAAVYGHKGAPVGGQNSPGSARQERNLHGEESEAGPSHGNIQVMVKEEGGSDDALCYIVDSDGSGSEYQLGGGQQDQAAELIGGSSSVAMATSHQQGVHAAQLEAPPRVLEAPAERVESRSVNDRPRTQTTIGPIQPTRKRKNVFLPLTARRLGLHSSREPAGRVRPKINKLPSGLQSGPAVVADRGLVAAETKRAQAQAELAKEEMKLVMLRQHEAKLRILLLQSRLQESGIVAEDCEGVAADEDDVEYDEFM